MNWVTLRKWRGPSPCGHISTLRRQHHVHRAGFGRDSLGTPLAKPYILHAHGPRPLLSGRKHGGAEINCQHIPVRGESDPISRAATLFLPDSDRLVGSCHISLLSTHPYQVSICHMCSSGSRLPELLG